jgi:site-specific DNA-methyltransferase (adenine-specific)
MTTRRTPAPSLLVSSSNVAVLPHEDGREHPPARLAYALLTILVPMFDLSGSDDLVVLGDNADVLPLLPEGSFTLAYVDPPFNTGRRQVRRTVKARRVDDDDPPPGAWVGFNGLRHVREETSRMEWDDSHDDYLGFLMPRLAEVRRLLAPEGTLYVHVDPRESHYVKVALDELFGRECFLNEVVWAYDFGGRPKTRWAPKHDSILVYVRDPERYWFSFDEVDRVPYMAPGLVGPEKAARGKLPTDVWWHTIVPTAGSEKTGYPTQKPLGVVRRAVAASSRPGDRVLDCFAGSGTTAAAARGLGRRFVMVDSNPEALAVMRRRLGDEGVAYAGVDGSSLG